MDVIKITLLYIYRLPFAQLGILTLAGTVIFLGFYCAARKQTWQRAVLLILSATYVLMILCATLLGRTESLESHGVSLLPFASYVKYFRGETELLRESIMNIVFFYPLGLLLGALTSEGKPLRKAILAAFVLSAAIELCQGIFRLGYAEVDDVIHNTLGAAAGVLVICAVRKVSGALNAL